MKKLILGIVMFLWIAPSVYGNDILFDLYILDEITLDEFMRELTDPISDEELDNELRIILDELL